MNNYHALMGILAALQISAVIRLKFTFANIKKKLNQSVKEMKVIFDSSSSWKNYRATLNESTGPTVPYIGIFLTDLTFIEDGNKALTKDGKINFSKHKLLAKVLNQVLLFQSQKYEFGLSMPEFSLVRS